VSRLVDALKNLKQPEAASEDAPRRKVTPRLSASIRKAVLGSAPAPAVSAAIASGVLFRVPAAQPIVPSPPAPAPVVASPVTTSPAAEPLAPARAVPTPAVTSPVIRWPVVTSAGVATPMVARPDPVGLVEAIQASISSLQQDASPAESVAPTATPAAAPVTPAAPARPQATAAEAELQALLSNEAHSRPYRDLVAMVRRDVAGKTTPVIAIVGLEGQESTEHVTAALGTLLAGQQTKTVLLIEANPARCLAKRYELPHASGLTEMLAGRTERSKAIAPTSHEQLDLLPFGQATEEQARLLPPALSAELAHARTTRGAVVIDAGPLSSPWAMATSQAADAAYLVVRVSDTSAEYATSCVHRFRASGGKLTGCIAVGAIS
jgi:Mrp family chromosome partitioning ATPase